MSLKIKILELGKLSLVLFAFFNYLLSTTLTEDKALNTFLGTAMAVLIDLSKRAYDSTKENNEPKEKKNKKKK